MEDGNNIIHQQMTFTGHHPTIAEYTFYSNTHGTFSRIYHILDHKTSLNKFKNKEIIQMYFSNNHEMKLETSNRRETVIFTNMWKLTHF